MRGRLVSLGERGASRLLALIIFVAWFGILGLIALNHRAITDWWRLRDYQAPASIAQLATQDTMTSYARKVFYVNQPAIDDKATFRAACPNNGGEQTIVLGCYRSDQDGIFLLNVTDQRLNGVTQVTAAHEMLHAAYDRLSSSERANVNTMLLDYYNHDLHDQRILSTIAAYKKSEPHDVVNEMHSVFGTEIANLPAGLEQYYQRYFANRQQIAAYAAQYQGEFTSRQAQVAQYDAQLTSLKNQIDTTEADLQTKQDAINTQHDMLLSERASDAAAYNADVPAYNASVDNYNNQVQAVRGLVDQYNALVADRNAIAVEQDELANALDANVAPITR